MEQNHLSNQNWCYTWECVGNPLMNLAPTQSSNRDAQTPPVARNVQQGVPMFCWAQLSTSIGSMTSTRGEEDEGVAARCVGYHWWLWMICLWFQIRQVICDHSVFFETKRALYWTYKSQVHTIELCTLLAIVFVAKRAMGIPPLISYNCSCTCTPPEN